MWRVCLMSVGCTCGWCRLAGVGTLGRASGCAGDRRVERGLGERGWTVGGVPCAVRHAERMVRGTLGNSVEHAQKGAVWSDYGN